MVKDSETVVVNTKMRSKKGSAEATAVQGTVSCNSAESFDCGELDGSGTRLITRHTCILQSLLAICEAGGS